VAVVRAGHPGMLRTAAAFGITEGACWVGRQSATNAVRRSKLTGLPSQMVGPQHLKHAQHGVCCTVAPVRGRNGCVGFIDLVSPVRAFNPEMVLLVEKIAEEIGCKIDRTYRADLRRLRDWAQRHLDERRYAGPALVIDRAGWVAWAHNWDFADKVAAPEGGFRLGQGEVDGLGRVVVEPLWGGRLVRRVLPGEETPPVRLALDLRVPARDESHAGRIRVSGPTVSWQHKLTTREAEVLLILAELRGRTYDQLAGDLYRDPPADGTVRSRWNRLRAGLGAILGREDGRQAYAQGVEVSSIDYPRNGADLLPGSTAPAVERLRRRR